MQRSAHALNAYRTHAIEALEIIGKTLPLLGFTRRLVSEPWFIRKIDGELTMAREQASMMAVALAYASDMEDSPELPDLGSLRSKLEQARAWTTEAGIAAEVRSHQDLEELGDQLFGRE